MTEKFEHKKSLGQHFLNSDYVPKKMCDAGNIQKGDIVLEIGPGTGILTRELLERGAEVVAVEADARAISSLEETFPEEIARHQLTIHHHDARKLNPSQFNLEKQGYKVVSNIPYYLSGLLFRSLLDTECQPNTLVFLIQKEVAERIARDKKESLLSLSVKIFGNPTYICTVKRGHFTPPPKIDSAIVAVNEVGRQKLSSITSEQFFNIIHLGFAQKRKQLLGNLSGEFPRPNLELIFQELSLPLDIRAEDIPLENWIKLTEKLYL
ncbi:ribosomal RNA small subunit methyltransferase A [Candidatus Kaiserbacteria bacterium]|nr:ribosomal RNA small subunit methyltransferase A [Candidatus Kaiserbacteria bacterium]MCB9817947.1 ribosomal RNA small subunit methyltransferase A [Candidatus Nomurabacteria bacterium]